MTHGFTFVLGLVLVAATTPALAQTPQLTTVWPPGGKAGSSVAARIEGANLAPTTSVWVGGKGVTVKMGAPAKDGNSVPMTLQIAADATPGPREVRAVSPKGASSPGYVWVGALPETAEVEPNDQPEKAMVLSNL